MKISKEEKMQKILNLPAQYLMLELAGFVAVLSVVVPVILKLAKKKDGEFRSRILIGGFVLVVVIIMLAAFIEIFNVNIRTFLTTVGKIILILVVILVCIYIFDQFIDWISKD